MRGHRVEVRVDRLGVEVEEVGQEGPRRADDGGVLDRAAAALGGEEDPEDQRAGEAERGQEADQAEGLPGRDGAVAAGPTALRAETVAAGRRRLPGVGRRRADRPHPPVVWLFCLCPFCHGLFVTVSSVVVMAFRSPSMCHLSRSAAVAPGSSLRPAASCAGATDGRPRPGTGPGPPGRPGRAADPGGSLGTRYDVLATGPSGMAEASSTSASCAVGTTTCPPAAGVKPGWVAGPTPVAEDRDAARAGERVGDRCWTSRRTRPARRGWAAAAGACAGTSGRGLRRARRGRPWPRPGRRSSSTAPKKYWL